MLDEVNAQHALQTNRWTAVACLGLVGINDHAQRCPWDYDLHRLQAIIAPSGLAVVLRRFVGRHGQGLLLHLCALRVSNSYASRRPVWTYSSLA
jgi:hypothetical protein